MKKQTTITAYIALAMLCVITLLSAYCSKYDFEAEKDAPYTLTVGTMPEAGGTTSQPGVTTWYKGDTVTVTARPNPGYKFSGWTGASNSKDTSITIVINGDRSLTAVFEIPTVLSNEKSIMMFGFMSLYAMGEIDEVNKTIQIELPSNTNVTALKPSIYLSPNAKVSPESDTEQDFSEPVTYTVTAEDGSTAEYTVTVTVAQSGVLSSAKQIAEFKFLSPDALGIINEADKTISVTVPAGTNLTKLKPSITTSAKATVSPKSDTEQDFSEPVTYTVTAEDNSKVDYIVTVTVAPQTFTLTLKAAENGSIDADPARWEYEEGTIVNLTAIPNQGHTLDYWTDDAAGRNGREITITMDDNKTVGAVFKVLVETGLYTVKYDANANTGENVKVPGLQTAEIDKSLTLSDDIPERIGYEFVEWNTQIRGDGGTSYNPGDEYVYNNDSPDNTVTLYARWDIVTYSISYNYGDGIAPVGGNPEEYTIETPTFTLNNPTYKNLTFIGWTENSEDDCELRSSVTIPQGSIGNRSYYAKYGSDDTPPACYRYEETLRINYRTLNFKMIRVEGGTFTMGCTSTTIDCPQEELPTREVILDTYYIGEFEVTRELYNMEMGVSDASKPITGVSLNEINAFIVKLNERTGKTYRLPTEAEWEYAARGGRNSNKYLYSGSDNLEQVAWYSGNSGSQSSDVGQKDPNELGIYDMSGNVWEVVNDWYDGSYLVEDKNNPEGPASGTARVIRGGSFYDNPDGGKNNFRVTARSSWGGDGTNNVGFRLAIDGNLPPAAGR